MDTYSKFCNDLIEKMKDTSSPQWETLNKKSLDMLLMLANLVMTEKHSLPDYLVGDIKKLITEATGMSVETVDDIVFTAEDEVLESMADYSINHMYD